MDDRIIINSAEKFSENPANFYKLCLYITGMTPICRKAIENIKTICDTHLLDNYELEIIDMYQDPLLAIEDQIIASPTLVKKFPLPIKKLIGNLSDTGKILKALDLA